ncbi:MAG: hypothetical protein ICV68_14320 [Pyrinomonadaceae bacterium]|nr:hypothetical protein [Pyrinomonadaceae bacterium]
MKAITTKMLFSLIGVALVAPFFVMALIIGARAVALAQDAQDDFLLVALAFGGAAVSMVNGMGRRTGRQERTGRKPRVEAKDEAETRGASMINLGY